MVRSWIRQALGASGVAILVPAAIVAAIGLSVLGGNGGVRSLNEVLAGPAAPPAEAVVAPALAQPRRDERPRLVVSTSRRPGRAVIRRASAPQPRITTRPLPSHRPGRVQAPAPASRPNPAEPGSPAPPPPPAAGPDPVRAAGTQVAQTIRPLPVAGPAAADAVQAVVDLVDSPH